MEERASQILRSKYLTIVTMVVARAYTDPTTLWTSMKALKRMKVGKALGPDNILIEVWRCLGDVAIVWLTKLFNSIFRSNKMLDELRGDISTNLQK